MSARASVIIRDPHCEIWLYRHLDGHPAACGADVVEIAARFTQGVRDLPTADNVADAFLRILHTDGVDCPAQPVYELTDGRHCVENYYLLDLKLRTIAYAFRLRLDSAEHDQEDWIADAPQYSVEEFARFVNGERALANERIASLKSTEPSNDRIQAMQPLPMVSV
jgi:hypothetical protein